VDVPAAFQLAFAAGWNQTEDDWRRLLLLEPDGCFGIEEGGRLVATATLLCHGREVAWLGMVLTHPDYRRRGFARRLVEETLALANARGIPSVKLDASDAGRPLYLDIGFRDEQPIERWRREPGPLKVAPCSFSIGPADAALDAEAFGADRSRFLAALGPVSCFSSGFVLHRNGSRARHLGPCVARDGTEAARAIDSIVASCATEPWFWDLLPAHTEAVEIARGLGFAPVRRLTRMLRGAAIRTDDRLVYAIAGFEAG
jgi:GNAT superfamily N-acetyltransferase